MARNLKNWLKAYMEFTEETESPACFHYWTAATLISAMTRRQVYLDLNMFKVYPNIYTILVGPSGARKSIATSIGMNIAQQVGIRRFSDKITGAALIRDLSQAVVKNITQVGNSNGAANNGVPTGGGAEIELTAPMLIYASELGVFLGHDAYGSGVVADLTDLYDCGPEWKKTTVSRGDEIIPGPYVTMLAASTPQTLKDTIPPGAVGQGFTSRILFVWGDGRRKRVPIPIWGAGQEMLRNNLIADLKKIGMVRGMFRFTPDALKMYTKNYMDALSPEEEYEDERLRNYASRKHIHTLKMAQICALAAHDELIITADDWFTADEAIKWLDKGLGNVFAGHGTANNSQDVIRVFKQIEAATARVGYISYPDLLKRNYSYLNLQEFGSVMQTLVECGAVAEAVAHDARTGKIQKMFKIVDHEFIQKWSGNVPQNLRNK
jgi:uncharacterized protein DUF3987